MPNSGENLPKISPLRHGQGPTDVDIETIIEERAGRTSLGVIGQVEAFLRRGLKARKHPEAYPEGANTPIPAKRKP